MKAYELMLITTPSVGEEGQTAVVERATGIITDDDGAVDSVDPWGARELAYEIDDLAEGLYCVLQFRASAAAVAELDRVLHITDDVLRSMIVRRDDLSHVAEASAT